MRLEATTSGTQTQVPSEHLSIMTLETSHTQSEQPANCSYSSSSEGSGEEDSSSCDDESASTNSSLQEEREVRAINLVTPGEDSEADELEPELHEGAVVNTSKPHHSQLSLGKNDDIHQEAIETEHSMNDFGTDDGNLKAYGHHHEGSPGTDSYEDEEPSSNSSLHEQSTPLPEHNLVSTKHEAGDAQSSSLSLEDSSSDGRLDATQGNAQSLSLQEAFLRRKEQFILKFQDRLQQLKVNAQKRQEETCPLLTHSTPKLLQHSGRLSKPSNVHQHRLGHTTKSEGIGEQSSKAKQRNVNVRQRAVTFSSPLAIPQDTGRFSPPKFLGT